MVEKVVLDYLSSNVTEKVLMEVPGTMPSEFYVLEKTGSSEAEGIFHSTIVVQSYAATLYRAAEMSDTIRGLMVYGLIEEPEIVSVELNSEYNFTDTATKKYRYQAVFDIVHY